MHTTTAIVLAGVAFWTIRGIYRIVLHPLRHFPGPWTAATTSFYRAYYDLVKSGGWTEHLMELHKRYGEFHIQSGPL